MYNISELLEQNWSAFHIHNQYYEYYTRVYIYYTVVPQNMIKNPSSILLRYCFYSFIFWQPVAGGARCALRIT
jgi:hypothetical protein